MPTEAEWRRGRAGRERNVMKIIGSLVLAPVSVMFAQSPVPPAVYGVVTIASCHARGDFAICVAGGTARRHPLIIRDHVSSIPGQRVTGAWTVVCSKGSGAGSKSGYFGGRTPVSVRMRLPYTRPDSCTASADAQLARSGRLHVWITAYERVR